MSKKRQKLHIPEQTGHRFHVKPDRSFIVKRRIELTGREDLFERKIQGDLSCQERGYLCEKSERYYVSNITAIAASEKAVQRQL